MLGYRYWLTSAERAQKEPNVSWNHFKITMVPEHYRSFYYYLSVFVLFSVLLELNGLSSIQIIYQFKDMQ